MLEPSKYSKALSEVNLETFRDAFVSEPRFQTAMNAVTKNSVNSVSMNRNAVVRNNHTYSHTIKVGATTNQHRSGRCWLFAGLNLFRNLAAEKMNLEEIELSQTYLMFWDKLEKSNYFLESMLQTLNEPTDGRLISWLIASPIQDGGQWDMFVNLVKKYGVVPKDAMPETESSGSSRQMNDNITTKLREFAVRLRKGAVAGKTMIELSAQKNSMLNEIYRMLCIHLGVPPTEFLWQWRDKDKAFHRDGILTPKAFMSKYIEFDLDSMVCLIHCPQKETPYNKMYTVGYLGNVVEGYAVRYLNVEMPILKQAAKEMIKDGKSVWFGCDVGKMFDRDIGLLDAELYDYNAIYGVEFTMDKVERLDYGTSLMTHAMVLTGVDLDDDDKPNKWRIENSWGDKGGDKGFMSMTDEWFDEYNYEVAVDKKHLSEELLSILNSESVVLPPWHPMGSLASSD